MSVLIFRLRNVPEDEADAIRDLLSEHQIDWYETTAGNWSIAMPGIWLKETADEAQARSLIDDYQKERRAIMRDQHEADIKSGNATSVWTLIRTQPLRVAAILIFCLFILYVTINPFMQLIGYDQ